MKQKINKKFVSEIDQFLAEFDSKRPRSKTQQAEFDKHQKVFEKRDTEIAPDQE